MKGCSLPRVTMIGSSAVTAAWAAATASQITALGLTPRRWLGQPGAVGPLRCSHRPSPLASSAYLPRPQEVANMAAGSPRRPPSRVVGLLRITRVVQPWLGETGV
jgi:hypothetical protein